MKKELNWGGGSTQLFIANESGETKLLDYEFDFPEIHQICGGRVFYTSRSGLSGSGFILGYEYLIPVGYYRVDTVEPWISFGEEPVSGINVLIPYASHQREKGETLEANPVVVKRAGKIWFCPFNELSGLLRKLVIHEDTPTEEKQLTKQFVDCDGNAHQIAFLFSNMMEKGSKCPSPWMFMAAEIQQFKVSNLEKLLFKIFHIGQYNKTTGLYVRTEKIGSSVYATQVIGSRPENGYTPMPGWHMYGANVVYKYNMNTVYAVAWKGEDWVDIEMPKIFYPDGLQKTAEKLLNDLAEVAEAEEAEKIPVEEQE